MNTIRQNPPHRLMQGWFTKADTSRASHSAQLLEISARTVKQYLAKKQARGKDFFFFSSSTTTSFRHIFLRPAPPSLSCLNWRWSEPSSLARVSDMISTAKLDGRPFPCQSSSSLHAKTTLLPALVQGKLFPSHPAATQHPLCPFATPFSNDDIVWNVFFSQPNRPWRNAVFSGPKACYLPVLLVWLLLDTWDITLPQNNLDSVLIRLFSQTKSPWSIDGRPIRRFNPIRQSHALTCPWYLTRCMNRPN